MRTHMLVIVMRENRDKVKSLSTRGRMQTNQKGEGIVWRKYLNIGALGGLDMSLFY